jgi:hypothetical protein
VARPFSKQRDSGRLHAKTERGRWPEEVTVVLEDKVVLVTGVAKGCGRVLAEAFAAEGAKLVGCDIASTADRRRPRRCARRAAR